jgi:cobalamin biosynthesis Mg chelatase CobN
MTDSSEQKQGEESTSEARAEQQSEQTVDTAATDSSALNTASESSALATVDIARATGPLHAAWAALERGDHVEAKRLALELAKSEDETVRKEAEAFLTRMQPDPMILLVLLGTLLLLAFLAVQYLGPQRA